MSSITISWIKNKSSTEELYQYTRNWLDNSFQEVIQSIERRVKELEKRYPQLPDIVREDIQVLKYKSEQYLNIYTPELANTPYHEKVVENWVKDFNEEAIKVKRKLAEYVLDSDKKKEELVKLIKQLNEIPIPNDEELQKEVLRAKQKIYHLIKNKQFIEAFEEILIILPRVRNFKDSKEEERVEPQEEKEVITQDNLGQVSPEEEKEEEKKEILKGKIEEKIDKKREEIDKLQLEIKSYLNLIKSLDETVYYKLEPLERQALTLSDKEQLEVIREKLKVEYKLFRKKYTLTKVFKEDIKSMLAKTDIEELIEDGRKLLNKKYINSEEFLAFYEEYVSLTSKQKKKKEVVEKLKKSFEELGYKFREEDRPNIKLVKGDIVYLDTPLGDEYKLAVKLEGHKLITRFTRLVQDEKELASLSEYEKIKDVEKAKDWCDDFNKLLKVMEKNGVEMEPKLIVEPSFDKIYYEIAEEVNELLRRKKKKEREQKQWKAKEL